MDAEEWKAKPNLEAQTHAFDGAYSWMETGVQALAASGWMAYCPLTSDVNVAKTAPPRHGKSKLYLTQEGAQEEMGPGYRIPEEPADPGYPK